MPKVYIDEQILRTAQQAATEGGFADVSEYIADLIARDRTEEEDGVAHFFTAELLARLDQISRDIQADGRRFTFAEMRDLFAGKGKRLSDKPVAE